MSKLKYENQKLKKQIEQLEEDEKIIEIKEVNLKESKNSKGYGSYKIVLPKKWVENIMKEDCNCKMEYNGRKIIIKRIDK